MEIRVANAFKLLREGGDFVIEFGAVLRDPATPGPAAVKVSDRIVLPLDIGRRLAIGLDLALQPHAAALRADAVKTLSPAEAAVAARPGTEPARPLAEAAGERAAQLIRMVGDLGVPYFYERSFRISSRALSTNRLVLSIDSLSIPGTSEARIFDICDRLSMPASARAEAKANFGIASSIHFGFEADARGVVCKLYLERNITVDEAAKARARREPVPLHLAYKWDLATGSAVTTRYRWWTYMPYAEIEERLAQIYCDRPRASLDIALAALKIAEDRGTTPGELQYVEVEEADNPRRSFDLNLYNVKLHVKDLQPLLNRMREHFEVRPGQWQALYDQIKGKTLGHLAGGVHRNGEDFFNVYYGVVSFPHFSARLGKELTSSEGRRE